MGLDFFQWLWVPSIGVTDETKRSVVGERMSETLRGACAVPSLPMLWSEQWRTVGLREPIQVRAELG